MTTAIPKLCILTVATAMLLTAAASGGGLRNVQVGEEAPAFRLPTLDGSNISSEDVKGKALILVFLSAQQRSSEAAAIGAHSVYRDLHHKELALLFVTADTAHTAYFRQQRDKSSVHEPLGLDFDRKLYGDLGLIVLPTTVIIDRDGKLTHVISAYKSDYEHVLNAYAQRALGLINDDQLENLLKTESFQRDRPNDRVARRRAAAQLLRQNGLTHDAENELRAALEIDPTHADTRLDLASLYVASDRVEEADLVVTGVLKDHPHHRRAKLLHGIVLYHSDRLDEAEKTLTEALMLNPDPVYTYYYLGLIYEKKGDLVKAAEHYRESLSRLLKDRPL